MAAAPASQGDRFTTLADGTATPTLGLGVWQVPNGPECVNAVRWALDAGYLHIDTAQQERIVENMEVFDFVLSAADMAELDACDETAGSNRALERPWWR